MAAGLGKPRALAALRQQLKASVGLNERVVRPWQGIARRHRAQCPPRWRPGSPWVYGLRAVDLRSTSGSAVSLLDCKWRTRAQTAEGSSPRLLAQYGSSWSLPRRHSGASRRRLPLCTVWFEVYSNRRRTLKLVPLQLFLLGFLKPKHYV